MSQEQGMSEERDESIEWIIPEEAGYKDRKMAKWEGFILSDHTEWLETVDAYQKRDRSPKERQSAELISQRLEHSFEQKRFIAIQLDFVENGQYEDDVAGVVKGFENHSVHIQTQEDFVSIAFDLIRHVSFPDSGKWFDQPPT